MNSRIRNVSSAVLSDNWYTLRKYTFDYRAKSGQWETQEREAYDRGNGATILLYNKRRKTIILTRQFRLPTYINGNSDGFLVEVCAGLLDGDDPLNCIRKETIKETGYHVDNVTKVFEAYMSPGSVTERLHFYIGEYDRSMKKSAGGGVAEEKEDIEVLELPIDKALQQIAEGEIIDGKTIMLVYHLRISGVL